MTFYYDSEEDAAVETHPQEWVHYNDEGELLIEFAHIKPLKRREFFDVAMRVLEGSDVYEFTTEPEYQWVPEDERGGD